MSETPKSPARWSVPILILSVVVGLGLGLATGAAVDRAVSPVFGEQGAAVAGLTTVVVVGIGLAVLSYRHLTRGKDGN